jgi:hypothetical protein
MTRWFVSRALVATIALLSALPLSAAQSQASPPLADPRDKRFQGVTEDWSSPRLSTSHLKPVAPLRAFIDDTHRDYTVELLQLQWRFGDPIDLYVLKPKGIKNPPVILNLYGYPADTDPYKNEVFQEALTRDGFAAVGFVSALTGHRYHDRPMRQWFLSELQECLAASAHDVQMILDYLASRGDLDMSRVGMFGQGSGATIAILAGAADARIKVIDVLDPWGDWPIWIADSPFIPQEERADYLNPEFLKKAGAMDPIVWIPKIQAKKFRLQQSLFETDTPTAAKEKIRSAMLHGTPIVLYRNLPEFRSAFPNSTNLQWMKQELRSLEEPADRGKTPAARQFPTHPSQ